MKYNLLWLILILVSGCSTNQYQHSLEKIFDDEWQKHLADNPILAIAYTPAKKVNKLAGNSLHTLSERAEADRKLLKRLEAIDYTKLDKRSQVNFRIFQQQLLNRVASFEFGVYQIPFNADSGFYNSFAHLHTQGKSIIN